MFKVFICCNDDQLLGAKVSKFSILSRESFLDDKIEIIEAKKNKSLNKFHGQLYLRDGELTRFDMSDLQSFTLLRFTPPKLMDYQGKALVIDPDVFLLNPFLAELNTLQFRENSIFCKEGKTSETWASSVMYLDCEKLKKWDLDIILEKLKAEKIDYRNLMDLNLFNSDIRPLEEKWNSYDNFDEETFFLHTTQRVTQPWRAGLKVNTYLKPVKPILGFLPRRYIHRLLKKPLSDRHIEHPLKKVSDFFFNEMSNAIKAGYIEMTEINEAIKKGTIRKDIYKKLSI